MRGDFAAGEVLERLTSSSATVGKISSLEISPSELILKVKMSGSVGSSPLAEAESEAEPGPELEPEVEPELESSG